MLHRGHGYSSLPDKIFASNELVLTPTENSLL